MTVLIRKILSELRLTIFPLLGLGVPQKNGSAADEQEGWGYGAAERRLSAHQRDAARRFGGRAARAATPAAAQQA
jgi:hypothetical protein